MAGLWFRFALFPTNTNVASTGVIATEGMNLEQEMTKAPYQPPSGEDPFQFCRDEQAEEYLGNIHDLSLLDRKWVDSCAPSDVQKRWYQEVYLPNNEITADFCVEAEVVFALEDGIEGARGWLDLCVPILKGADSSRISNEYTKEAIEWWKSHSVDDITPSFCFYDTSIYSVRYMWDYVCDRLVEAAKQPVYRDWLSQRSDLAPDVIDFCCSDEYTEQYYDVGFDDIFEHDPEWKEACEHWIIEANQHIDWERVFEHL